MGARSNPQDIDELAADWAARLDGRSLTDEEQAQLDSWISADSRHDGSFIRARAALSLLDGIRNTDDAPQRWAEPLKRAPTRRALWGGAAAIAASVVGGVLIVGHGPRVQTFTTRAGEVRRLTFPGGGELLLDARSQIRTTMNPGLRLVSIDTGRAAFDTRRGPSAPLVVQAGDLRLQASRSSFSASRLDDKVDLLVEHGTVEAWNSEQPVIDRLVLQSGAQAKLTRASLVDLSTLSGDDLARAEAWKTGRLALAGDSVADAVVSFNRHNQLQLVIASPQLGRQAIVGYFYLNDPLGFASALEASFKVRARRRGDQIILE